MGRRGGLRARREGWTEEEASQEVARMEQTAAIVTAVVAEVPLEPKPDGCDES